MLVYSPHPDDDTSLTVIESRLSSFNTVAAISNQSRGCSNLVPSSSMASSRCYPSLFPSAADHPQLDDDGFLAKFRPSFVTPLNSKDAHEQGGTTLSRYRNQHPVLSRSAVFSLGLSIEDPGDEPMGPAPVLVSPIKTSSPSSSMASCHRDHACTRFASANSAVDHQSTEPSIVSAAIMQSNQSTSNKELSVTPVPKHLKRKTCHELMEKGLDSSSVDSDDIDEEAFEAERRTVGKNASASSKSDQLSLYLKRDHIESNKIMTSNSKSAVTSLMSNRLKDGFESLRLHSCEECGKAFTASSSLKIHKFTHTGDRPYACEECGKAFITSTSLKMHMRIHTGDRPHACEECGKAFITASKLKEHMWTHIGDRPFTCEECGQAFSKSASLKKHSRIHTGERSYACQVCGQAFSQSTSFSMHMRIHTRDRPYACEVCGKAFTASSSLIVHMRTHTGDRPYACEECGKAFTTSSSLIVHMRIHTGDRPYACEECGKAFTTSSSLKWHMRSHTGDRPCKE